MGMWDNVEMPASEGRRLPVYLLLDTSGSMDGAPIESLRSGLEQFKSEVMGDEISSDCVHVGVITFADDAELVTGNLQLIESFEPPTLTAAGVTRLDKAFQVLRESVDRDLKRPIQGGKKGDYKPMIFVLTDGQPTDENGYESDLLWKPERDALVNRPSGKIKPNNIVAVGCGPNCKDETLKGISTGIAFRMGTDKAAFVALFEFLSMSIACSLQAGNNPDDDSWNQISISNGMTRIP